jgi:hypothetical protein
MKPETKLPKKLECNMIKEHISYFYTLSFISRLIASDQPGGGISEQTRGYIELELLKAGFPLK